MSIRADQIRWPIVIAMILGCVLAVYLGLQIGEENYTAGLYIVSILCLIVYVGYLQRYTWQIALLICYIGFFYRPFGFDFGPTEVTCSLAVLLVLVTWWQKPHLRKAGLLKHRRFRAVRFLLLLWIVYVLIHMWYNIHNPFRPAEFALKNALKTYFGGLMPIAMLWYFSGNPTSIRVKRNVTRTLIILLLLGLIVNLAIAVFGILMHHNVTDPDVRYIQTYLIPGLNAFENPYMLRSLGPLAVLFGAVTLRFDKGKSGAVRGLAFLLLLLGVIGSLISGGRAAAVTAICLVLVMCLLTRQVRGFFVVLMLSGLFVLFANLFSDWINHRTPVAIARPLQWVMFTKSTVAEGS